MSHVSGRRLVVSAIGLAFLAGLIVVERWHTADEPMERDVAGYVVIGHEMMAGRNLYSDLWERKPPLLYSTFAAAERVVGFGPREVLLVNVVAALATLAGVCAAAGRGGWVGGLFWALVGGDVWLQANQPNAELLVNASLTAAFAILVWWPTGRRWRWVSAVGVGAALAGATLNKQHVVIAAGLLLAGHAVLPRAGTRIARRAAESAVAAGVVAVCWAAVIAHFAIAGRFGAMVEVLVGDNAAYAGSLGGNLLRGLEPVALFYDALTGAVWPMAALVVVAAVVVPIARRRPGQTPVTAGRAEPAHAGLGRPWSLWLLWAVATWAEISLPGPFATHYYQLWLPPACVAGGWAAAALVGSTAGRWRWGAVTAVAAAAVAVGVRQLSQYRLSADEWAALAYRSTPNFDSDLVLHRQVARDVAALLRPGDTLWNMGEDNELYVYARRSPPTGLLYVDPLIFGPSTDRYWQRLMADLTRRPPDLILVSRPTARLLPASAPVFAWMRQGYAVAMTGDLGRPVYRVFVRRGTDLYRRLNGRAATSVPATTPAAPVVKGTAP